MSSSTLNEQLNIEFEDWNLFHYSSSIGDLESIKQLITSGNDINLAIENKIIPQTTPLHIACRCGNIEVVKALISLCELNQQDQWGFTPLHYAITAKHRDIINILLSNGASTLIKSKNGSTAKELAEYLKLDDVVDTLTSKETLENDPTLPQFKEWLNHLGGGEFTMKFLDAGYDLPFIVKHKLTDEDLNCIGIPTNKMGLRRKILTLHHLEKFYQEEEEEEDEEEDEDEEDEDDEEDEEEDD